MTTNTDTPSTDGAGNQPAATGPWQISIGPCLACLVVGIVIVSMVARIGGLTTTRHRNHPRGTHP